MKIIALYNIKGGVGKTAAAVNLAYLASCEGARVLLFDLDPQSATTFYFRIKPRLKKGIKNLVKNVHSVDKRIKGTDYDNLDLLPADASMRKLDLLLERSKKATRKLAQLLKPLKAQYDYIFLDCPPNITLVSENVFYAADYLLIPVIPTTLSVRTFEQILHFFSTHKMSNKKVIPFFSMVEKRKKMHAQCLQTVREKYPSFLETYIPYRSEIEQMGIHRRPLVVKRNKSTARLAYQSLWNEFYALMNQQERLTDLDKILI
jgi:chromosome partitioning protein